MNGILVLSRIFIVIAVLCGILWILVPDLFKKKTKPTNPSTLDEIEKDTIDILNKKNEIRGVTEQTQKQINNINKNLEK